MGLRTNQIEFENTTYDRLGWYFNEKLFWGEEVVDRNSPAF
ncbi:hypothetical protein [Arthrobacter sp. UYEF3]